MSMILPATYGPLSSIFTYHIWISERINRRRRSVGRVLGVRCEVKRGEKKYLN